MTTTVNIDYISTDFEYPVLSKIHGKPIYPSLKPIKDKIKANTANVASELGGEGHGNLRLVLTPIKYLNVSEIAYV